MKTRPTILPHAVLFDMDGTLTEPVLNFAVIKSEMGIGERPILEALVEMAPAERLAAETILHRHEEQAAADSVLNPGCEDLLARLASEGILSAVVTRNSRRSVEHVIRRHRLAIEVLISREDAPPKPDPQPLFLACQRLGVLREKAWMVGDGQFDIEAGLAANIPTIWLSHGREKPFAETPWREVRDLWELHGLMFGEEA